MSDQENPVVTEAAEADTLTSPKWPRDIYGISSGLRREIARTAGRLNGDPQKLEVFMDTLKAGAKWARSRMEVQTAIKKHNMERENERQTAEQVIRDADDKRAGPNESPAERRARQDTAGVKGSGVNGA